MLDWLILGGVVTAGIAVAARRAAEHRGLPGCGACFADATARGSAEAVERTFVFADLVGFTAFAQEHGDAVAAWTASRFQWVVRRSLRGDAVLLKALGDGVMLAAADPAAAVTTALTLARLVEDDAGLPPVSVGVHRGAAVEMEGDYYGNAVNLAARVAEEARPGQVVCTEAAVETMGDAAQALPLGVAALKGVPGETVLYELVERERTGGRR